MADGTLNFDTKVDSSGFSGAVGKLDRITPYGKVRYIRKSNSRRYAVSVPELDYTAGIADTSIIYSSRDQRDYIPINGSPSKTRERLAKRLSEVRSITLTRRRKNNAKWKRICEHRGKR